VFGEEHGTCVQVPEQNGGLAAHVLEQPPQL